MMTPPPVYLRRGFSLLGHFHLPFHMINVATRVTMVTCNDNSASMPIKAFGPVTTPRAAKWFWSMQTVKVHPAALFCAPARYVTFRLPLLWGWGVSKGDGEGRLSLCHECVSLLSLQWGCWPCPFQLSRPRVMGSTVISVFLLPQKDAPSCCQLWQACSSTVCPHLKMWPAFFPPLNCSEV